MLSISPPPARWLLPAAVGLAMLQTLPLADLHDVSVYRAAGQLVLRGGAVYGFRHHGLGFTYPPFAALLMTGPATLPLPLMWCLFDLLSVGALALIVQLALPGQWTAARHGDRAAALRIGGLLLVAPVAQTLRLGQVDLLLVALVMVDLLVLRRGMLVGLATAIKLTPGLFVVYLLMRRRYREAATATAVFTSTVVAAAVVMPSASRTYWLHNLLAGAGLGPMDGAGNQSLRGLAVRVLGPQTGTFVWLGLALPTLVAGLALAGSAAHRRQEELAVAVVGITACLVSPLSWNHHWVWVLPALAGLWRAPWLHRRGLHRWLLIVVAVLTGWGVLPWGWQSLPIVHYLGTGLVPLALLTAVWAVLAARSPTRSGVEQSPGSACIARSNSHRLGS